MGGTSQPPSSSYHVHVFCPGPSPYPYMHLYLYRGKSLTTGLVAEVATVVEVGAVDGACQYSRKEEGLRGQWLCWLRELGAPARCL